MRGTRTTVYDDGGEEVEIVEIPEMIADILALTKVRSVTLESVTGKRVTYDREDGGTFTDYAASTADRIARALMGGE